MMRPKAWIALLLLCPAVLLDRLAYYGARAHLFQALGAAGVSSTRAEQLLTVATSLSYLVSVAAGGLAFVIGPRLTAVAGSLVSAVGLGLLVGGTTPEAGLVVMMLGAGLFRPCCIAAAAEIVSGEDVGPSGEALPPSARRFAVLAAIATVIYGGVNLFATLAPVASGAIYGGLGTRALFGSCLVLELVIALLVGVSALVSLSLRASRPAAGPPDAIYRTQAAHAATSGVAAPNAIAGLALLAIPTLLHGMASSIGWAFMPFEGVSAASQGLLQMLNPAVVVVASLGLAIAWIVSAAGRAQLLPMRVWGVGFAIAGLGMLPLALGLHGGTGMFLLGTAVGEAAIAPIVTTYAVLAVKPRAAALSVALMGLVGWLSYSGSTASALGIPGLLLTLGGLSCLAIGILAALFAPRIHQKLFAPATG